MSAAPSDIQTVVRNRRARHEYEVLEYGEMWLYNLHISPYEQGNRFNHDPLRPRKLLLQRRELRKLNSQVEQQGLTLVPLDIYFKHGIAKVTIAMVRGKKLHDKRDDLRKRDAEREMERAYNG